MKAQEILEGICRHRSNRAFLSIEDEMRKIDEIEWALQAMAEKLVELEAQRNVTGSI